MKISGIIRFLTLSWAAVLFSAQLPRTPTINKAALIPEKLMLPLSGELTHSKLVIFESKCKKGTQILYDGILLTTSDGRPSQMCKIIYDSTTDTYTGHTYYYNFSDIDVAMGPSILTRLNAQDAKAYYLELVSQDPDKNKMG